RCHVHHHAGSPRAKLGDHRLRHGHHAKRVGLEHLAYRRHRRGFEGAADADASVVDEHIDGSARFERAGDAVGLRHVERDDVETFGPGQYVFAWGSHGRNHRPTVRMKVSCGFQTVAGRATSNKHSLHMGKLRLSLWTRYDVESRFHL